MIRNIVLLFTALFITTPVFATYLGNPVNIKGGGTGLATIPSAGQMLLGNAGGTAYALALMSGDATLAASGALTIATSAISNAKMADMAAATIKGRAVGAGTGAPVDLSGTQATAILDVFTSGLQGLAPASGGGSTNFLRADGTWAAPAGSSGITELTGDVTAGPGSGSQAATIANLAVTNAKIANSTIDLTAKVTGILPNGNTTAASANTASAIVARDGSGDFSAGTITAALTGTASGNELPLTFGSGVTRAVNAISCDSATGAVKGCLEAADFTAFSAKQAALSTSAAVANQFITAFTAPNTFSRAQPAFSDLSGTATAAQLPAPNTSAIAAVDIDWSTLKNVDGLYTKTLSGNITLTFSNVTAGQTIVIALTNTASNFTVGWPAAAKWSGGTAPTQTIGAKTDLITCKAFNSTDAYCSSVQNF